MSEHEGHTPGPWRVEERPIGWVVVDHGEKTAGERLLSSIHPYAPSAEANARLIAAAPALLEACEMVSQIMPPDWHITMAPDGKRKVGAIIDAALKQARPAYEAEGGGEKQ